MPRWQEVPLAAALLIVSLPIQAMAGIMIFFQLGSPILFHQDRVGHGGKSLCVPKFRTMSDARDRHGRLLPDAERVTTVTRLLRRLRLDELPQLAAVVSGRMSLVGPRPLLASTLAQVPAAAAIRNSVRPGITGWAQVCGNTHLSDAEKLALDLWYVAHRSPRLDLMILRETLAVALLGERRDENRLNAAIAWAGLRNGSLS